MSSIQRIWLYITAAVLLLGISGCGTAGQSSPPQAVRGQLDLSDWPFRHGKTAALRGEWAFYSHRLLAPGTDWSREHPHYVILPKTWNSYPEAVGFGSGQGYATYRLTVGVPREEPLLALQLPNIFTAYTLYVNGQAAAGMGKVADRAGEAQAAQEPRTVIIPAGVDRLELLLQVSNYQHRRGGIWADIRLGTPEAILHARSDIVNRQMMLFGALTIIGLYHIGLFALRREERFTLHFGLLCLFVAVRITVTGENFLLNWLPFLGWEAGMKIEYLSLVGSALTGYLYVYHLFPRDAAKLSRLIVSALSVVFSLYVLLSPAYDYTRTLPVFQMFVMMAALYALLVLVIARARGREGASFVLAGVFIFIMAIINDMLLFNEWLKSTELVPTGLFFFVLMQAAILSRRFSRALRKVEDVSAELRELNVHLEERIGERTDALRRSNEALESSNLELEKLHSSRRQLLSNISHDLRTPMTLIQGYLEAMQDGVVQGAEQQEKYVRMMLGKVGGLNRLIGDLFELSKLESGQAAFHIEEVTAAEWMAAIGEQFETDIRGQGLAFACRYEQSRGGPAAEELTVQIDLTRMNRVIGNLVYNALKYTEAGGAIEVVFRYEPWGSRLLLDVADTGSGIDEADLPYIFDRFYKKDKSRNSAGGGSGIGLAIVKEIVEQHEGRIQAESRSGAGTVFRIELPSRAARSVRH